MNRELHNFFWFKYSRLDFCRICTFYEICCEGKKGGKGKKVPTNAPASIATSPSLPSFDIDTVRPAAVVVFPQTNTDLGATAAAALNNWLWNWRR